MDIKIEIFKNSGKWYTTEYVNLKDIEVLDKYMQCYSFYIGMITTVSYMETNEDYYQPYRMYKL